MALCLQDIFLVSNQISYSAKMCVLLALFGLNEVKFKWNTIALHIKLMCFFFLKT